MVWSASASASTPSASAISRRRSATSAVEMRRKSKRWQRETMVAGRRCGSVVARMNTVLGGGSSSVFRNASAAGPVMACASSMM